MPSPKYPYRNHMERKKGFKFLDYYYEQGPDVKPEGFWYQLRGCLFGGDVCFGEFLYKVELKQRSLAYLDGEKSTNKILVLSSKKDVEIFDKKYGVDYSDGEGEKVYRFVDWEKVSEDYGGFEIKNYIKIKKEIKETNMSRKLLWVTSFDFSSGCIWNTAIIKNVSYERKLTEKETDKKYKYKSC
jgi:hypothetical protein